MLAERRRGKLRFQPAVSTLSTNSCPAAAHLSPAPTSPQSHNPFTQHPLLPSSINSTQHVLPVSSHLCPPTLPHHLALVLQSHKPAKLPATGEESKEAITQESGVAAKPPSALAEKLKPKPQNWKKTGLARTQNGCSLRARCGRAPSEELRTQR